MAVTIAAPCPGCRQPTTESPCPACGMDTTDVLAIRLSALSAAREGWALADAGRISQALARVRVAWELDSRPEGVQSLLALLTFCSGDTAQAWQLWPRLAEATHPVVASFNDALRAAKAGDPAAALRTLGAADWQFLPALRLAGACACKTGDYAALDLIRQRLATAFPEELSQFTSPEEVTVRPSAGRRLRGVAAIAAIALLSVALGTAAGWRWHAEAGDVATDTIRRAAPGTNPPQATAGGTRSSAPISVEVTGALPIRPNPAFAILSPDTRTKLARHAYLAWLRRNGGVDAGRDSLLQAAFALVGAGSTEYWVDDALYGAMLALEHTDHDRARVYATVLNTYHASSPFRNSRVRSMLTGSGGARP